MLHCEKRVQNGESMPGRARVRSESACDGTSQIAHRQHSRLRAGERAGYSRVVKGGDAGEDLALEQLERGAAACGAGAVRRPGQSTASERETEAVDCAFAPIKGLKDDLWPHIAAFAVSAATGPQNHPTVSTQGGGEEERAPVEMCDIFSARPAFSTAATESPPPMMVMAPCAAGEAGSGLRVGAMAERVGTGHRSPAQAKSIPRACEIDDASSTRTETLTRTLDRILRSRLYHHGVEHRVAMRNTAEQAA